MQDDVAHLWPIVKFHFFVHSDMKLNNLICEEWLLMPKLWKRWKDISLALPYFFLVVKGGVTCGCEIFFWGFWPVSHIFPWSPPWSQPGDLSQIFPRWFFSSNIWLVADLKSWFGNVFKAMTLIVLKCSGFARKIMK